MASGAGSPQPNQSPRPSSELSPQGPDPPDSRPSSPLNPLAPEFVPFSLGLPPFDDDDELADDSDLPEHLERIDHLAEDTLLWSKFDESDHSGKPPPPCQCHNLPRGSCPEIMAYY